MAVNGKPYFKRVAQCLYRNSDSNVYYALVKRRGRQHRKSLKTTDRQLAERRLNDFRGQVGRFATPTKERNITFTELAKDWFDVAKTRYKASSARGAEVCLKQLNKQFGLLPIRNITTADFHNWEKKRGANVSASSFNHERTFLVAVLNYAIREGLITENPALLISRRKMPKRKIVIPSRTQLATLINTIRSFGSRARHGADLVEILAYSGMRLSEATGMVWGDIDFERGQFVVTGGAKGTKNHEVRTVPLFPALRSLFERMKQQAKPADRIIPISTAKKAIFNACKKGELPHFHHHLFRHFFVSQAIENGVDFKTISAWVGHKDGGVLVAKTYGHLSDVHSAEMAKKMIFYVG
ncbi:MAG TPA: tyrosine-type recombinase/integrase [Verrucomicrobiae bacterium]|nr:tyrosine-type recombinase/integrase [Verrucomicrobiae bacterium]